MTKPDRFDGKRNEWITPKPIIDAFVRSIGGGPWLDPFSPSDNPLGASVFFTEEQNSLTREWPDMPVWCNPPFSRGQLRPCLERLADEWKFGRRGMLLLPINNRLETEYYHRLCLTVELSAVVILRSRIAFEERVEDGLFVTYEPRKSNLFATHLLCYNLDRFDVHDAFNELGTTIGGSLL